jgi:hypothetical protein
LQVVFLKYSYCIFFSLITAHKKKVKDGERGYMKYQIKRTIAILLLVCFLLSVTAAAVSASQKDYSRGYRKGIRDGYTAGFKACKEERGAYGEHMYRKAIAPTDYDTGYEDGFDIGHRRGYEAAGCSV